MGRVRALIMYGAVCHFGPRWDDPKAIRAMRHVGDGMQRDAMRMRQYVKSYALPASDGPGS